MLCHSRMPLDANHANSLFSLPDFYSNLPAILFMNFSNNPDMVADPSQPLPFWLEYDYGSVTFFNSKNLYCPGFRPTFRSFQFALDHSYNGYDGCKCTSGSYRQNGECVPCLTNGEWQLFEDVVTLC